MAKNNFLFDSKKRREMIGKLKGKVDHINLKRLSDEELLEVYNENCELEETVYKVAPDQVDAIKSKVKPEDTVVVTDKVNEITESEIIDYIKQKENPRIKKKDLIEYVIRNQKKS